MSSATPISRWPSSACPCGGRGRDRVEIPQRRPDLRLRQPDFSSGRRLRRLTKRLAETAGAMKVADGFEPGAVIGPLIDMKAVEKVEAHIGDALKKGAKIVIGGKRSVLGGSFFEPTVLTDVTTDMLITREETFEPVAPLYRFKSEDEAIRMANHTQFVL